MINVRNSSMIAAVFAMLLLAAPAQTGIVAEEAESVTVRITFADGSWAVVTQTQGQPIRVEDRGKVLAITPLAIEKEKRSILVSLSDAENGLAEDGARTFAAAVGKAPETLQAGDWKFTLSLLGFGAGSAHPSAAGDCCVRDCAGRLICGKCVCTQCSSCGIACHCINP